MQFKFALNGLRLAKHAMSDLPKREFSAKNREFTCPFFHNPDLRGFFGKITGY